MTTGAWECTTAHSSVVSTLHFSGGRKAYRDSEALMSGEGRTYIVLCAFLIKRLLRERIAPHEMARETPRTGSPTVSG